VRVTHRPPIVGPRPTWHERAACRDKDPEIFFGQRGVTCYTEARAICARCPVQPECLAHAMAPGRTEQFGFWGGTSELDRRKLRRRGRRSASGQDLAPAPGPKIEGVG
jgi:WhiB family transcriptional regulator, redox-sensing transcriptional regulator